MSEDTSDQPGQQLAVRRERMPVADIVPIFDSARFEHYGRIASVMAQSTLVPATLRAGQPQEAIANCIQVVEFADRAGYSPFAVAQCASVVHGKLMFEGKLVDAMLQTKLGIELKCYYTGERGKDERRIYVTDTELTEEQYDALEPGKYPFGIKMIDGSIGEWKTFEKGGGVSKAWQGQQSEMQLGYKGKRTWSRFFKPSVMLGVITEDEVEDFSDRRLEAPEAPAASFADAPKPPRTRRKAETPPASDDAGQRGEGPSASQEAADGGENVEDAEFEDGAMDERPTSQADDTATAGVQSAEAEPATSESAETAPAASQDQTASSPPQASELTGHGSIAPRDTVYRLTTDEPGDDGKIPTYKNGKAFSRVKQDAKVMPDEFDEHAPVEEEPPEEEEQPQGDEGPTDPMGQTIANIREAPSFEAAEAAMKGLTSSEGFKERYGADAQRGLRLAAWVRYGELLEEGLEGIEAHENFTLMRLFLEFGAKSAAEIDEQWRPFWRSTYKATNEGNQRAITDLMTKRKAELAAAP